MMPRPTGYDHKVAWARRLLPVISMSLAVGTGLARDKAILPAYVLQARTVAVLIDPDAGIAINDPTANQSAQQDVESALLAWHRLEPVLSPRDADLVIVVRKGNKQLAQETISNPRPNSRPGSVTQAGDSIHMGAQHGGDLSSGDASVGSGASADSGRAHPQLELGRAEDSLSVYAGGANYSLMVAPAWRWVRKDALHPHDVPAVTELRKAMVEAEKRAGAKKP